MLYNTIRSITNNIITNYGIKFTKTKIVDYKFKKNDNIIHHKSLT